MIKADKARKAKEMRYKKPMLATLGYSYITDRLWEMVEYEADVKYLIDSDALLEALDGDEEEEYEFRMAFSDLYAKSSRLQEELSDHFNGDISEYFDDCTVALIGNRYRLEGYDVEEEDYFSLSQYEERLACTEAGKRLMRHTKGEIISMVGQCFGILLAFYDIEQQFEHLKNTADIITENNRALLASVKRIEELYEKLQGDWPSSEDIRAFDEMTAAMPERFWLE